LLLVVLSMLVIFVLIAITFVLVSSQEKDAAKAAAKRAVTGTDPQRLLDGAMYQLVRDTEDPASKMKGHSLLRDIYGDGGDDGIELDLARDVAFTDIVANGQFVTIQGKPADGEPPLSVDTDHYNGRILTFIRGPWSGVSTRVIDYVGASSDPSTSHVFTLLVPGDLSLTTNLPTTKDGTQFIVNGRPFDGFRFERNAATGSMVVIKDVNESYDAADVENMFLAAQIPDAADPSRIQFNIPSFDRSASGGLSLRPKRDDNPNFPKLLAPYDGSLDTPPKRHPHGDVDNDGDGRVDSIWMDLGYPVTRAKDGRLAKPLFAILCVDLDGRLNLNAHDSNRTSDFLTTFLGRWTPITAAGEQPLSGLPKGQGYGPADIHLDSLFPNGKTDPEFRQLLVGTPTGTTPSIPGRYGFFTTTSNPPVLPGEPGERGRFFQAGIDVLAQQKFFDYPRLFRPLPVVQHNFGYRMDVRGIYSLALSDQGAPLFEALPDNHDQLSENPYELNLSNNASRGVLDRAVDTPFTPAELERILRIYDPDDAALATRLLELAPSLVGHRHEVTTDSFDVPVSHRTFRELLRKRGITMASNKGLVLALEKRLARDMTFGLRMNINQPFGNGRDDGTSRDGVVDDYAEVDRLAYPRPDGTSDDPKPTPPQSNFDATNDGTYSGSLRSRQRMAERLYLLMMTLLKSEVAPHNFVHIDFDGNPGNDSDRETAFGVAQWAINAVDFRDADSVMTPFEFDINPFNGTPAGTQLIDGIIDKMQGMTSSDDADPDRGLVWGCERPELLITETLAFHDRRTEDRQDAGPMDKYTQNHPSSPSDPDPDFDQRLRPRSGVFIELYNPWGSVDNPSGAHDQKPGDLYYDSNGNRTDGVVLNKVGVGGSPVWRMVVVRGNSHLRDSDPDGAFDPQASSFNMNDIERTIYFTRTKPALSSIPADGEPFWTDRAVAPIRAGRYAIVGSAEQRKGNTFVTTVGRRDTADDSDLQISDTRRFLLTPNADPNINQFQLASNGLNPSRDPPAPVVAVAINQPRSLSITDPTDRSNPSRQGYPGVPGAPDPRDPTWDETAAGGDGAFVPPKDKPFDANRGGDWDILFRQNGTHPNFRTLHLQRLANPNAPYDRLVNPYLTIDTSSLDVTVFNGVRATASAQYDDPSVKSGKTSFATFERGRPAPGQKANLWYHQPPETNVVDAPKTDRTHVFPYQLTHSLGLLNESFWPTPGTWTPGTINPAKPFAWLTWNNRPYVSQFELMLVPYAKSSRLTYRHSFYRGGDVYKGTDLGTVTGNSLVVKGSGFRHLLNFLDDRLDGPRLYRLFEYTCVPSRYAGTETIFNPMVFGRNPRDSRLDRFRPPFNRLSTFREPGKININTIFSRHVWEAGVMHRRLKVPGTPWNLSNDYDPATGHAGPNWNQLVASRRGYGKAALANSPDGILDDDSDPTNTSFFMRPFRAFDIDRIPASKRIEENMLRRPPASKNDKKMLFESSSTSVYDNTDRTPYFRYQALTRLGNLITTRSNVYAVWITVGFFEVEPHPGGVDSAHPDGFQLAQELGSDTGQIVRHRAFYIIDRSIPVAFEPGVNHNVDKAVVLRRFIE